MLRQHSRHVQLSGALQEVPLSFPLLSCNGRQFGSLDKLFVVLQVGKRVRPNKVGFLRIVSQSTDQARIRHAHKHMRAHTE